MGSTDKSNQIPRLTFFNFIFFLFPDFRFLQSEKRARYLFRLFPLLFVRVYLISSLQDLSPPSIQNRLDALSRRASPFFLGVPIALFSGRSFADVASASVLVFFPLASSLWFLSHFLLLARFEKGKGNGCLSWYGEARLALPPETCILSLAFRRVSPIYHP